MRKSIGVVLTLMLAGLAVGCSSGPDYTVKGTVISKDKEYECGSSNHAAAMALPGFADKATSRSGTRKSPTDSTKGTTPRPVPRVTVLPVIPAPAAGKTDEAAARTSPKATATKTKKKSAKCGWDYEVDVRQADNTVVEVDVTEDHYGRCESGEPFPACTHD